MNEHVDDQNIITTHAFTIAPELLGKPLAAPLKRLLAIGVDLLVIAMLAKVPAIFLIIGLAYLLLRLTSKKNSSIEFFSGKLDSSFKRFVRWSIRISAILIFLIVGLVSALVAYEYFNSDIGRNVIRHDDGRVTVHGIEIEGEISDDRFDELRGFFAMHDGIFAANFCPDMQCRADLIRGMDQSLDHLNIEEKAAEVIRQHYLDQLELDENGLQALQEQMNKVQSQSAPGEEAQAQERAEPERSNHFSIIQIVQGIFTDLGLSFGWSVLYFSLLTTIWHGRTLGKKILGIRVIQLDGTRLTLWESFGRYGGYAAGLSTGLLGFAQIFWDSNRQAIQDKISSTVVIDERKSNKLTIVNKDSTDANTM